MAMVRWAEVAGVVLNLAYTWLYLNGTVPLAYLFAGLGAVALGWACSGTQAHPSAEASSRDRVVLPAHSTPVTTTLRKERCTMRQSEG